MSPPPCFLPPAGRFALPRPAPSRPYTGVRRPAVVARRRRAAPLLCAEAPRPGDDGHASENGLPAPDPGAPLPPEDRLFDDAVSTGASSLEEIADSVRTDLQGVLKATRAFADSAIAEETEALLAKYEDRRKELLDTIFEERHVIEAELGRVSELADKYEKSKRRSNTSVRGKLMTAVAGVFSIAAILYAFSGVVDNDSGALGSAAVDAACAAAAAYFVKRDNDASKETEA